MKAFALVVSLMCAACGSDDEACGNPGTACVVCENEPFGLCSPECAVGDVSGAPDGPRCAVDTGDSVTNCTAITVDGVQGCCLGYTVGFDPKDDNRIGWFECVD